MLFFPQLSTGASVLYPTIKRRNERTIVNRMADGSTHVFADPDGTQTDLELRARGLTRAEWAAIVAHFRTAQGMLTTFTLLDPTENLLAESENFSNSVWFRSPGVQLLTGILDPMGSARATSVTNTAAIPSSFGQMMNAPGDYQYCFSVWLRSTAAAEVVLSIASGVAQVARLASLTNVWQRIFVSGSPAAATTQVSFALELRPGDSVEVYGPQAEAQLAPSAYRRTGAVSGLRLVRFNSDHLTVTAQSSDVYDADIVLVSVGN